MHYVSDDGVTILTQAAHKGLDELVQLLIAKGADMESASTDGLNPLIAAASEGHPTTVAILLEKGANVNANDTDGTTSLMAAAVRGHKDVVQKLLLASPSVNAQNSDGHTALMFAYNGKSQVQNLLYKYSDHLKVWFLNNTSSFILSSSQPHVSSKDTEDSNLELIRQALATHIEVIKMLLYAGADHTIEVSQSLSLCISMISIMVFNLITG